MAVPNSVTVFNNACPLNTLYYSQMTSFTLTLSLTWWMSLALIEFGTAVYRFAQNGIVLLVVAFSLSKYKKQC